MDFTVPNDESHVVDMDAVGEASFELYNKGWYDFTISDMSYELSQSSGAPMWSLQLEFDSVIDPMTNEPSCPYAGKKMRWYLSFSEKAIPYTKKTINQLWPGLLEDPQWKTNGKFDIKKVGDNQLFVGHKIRGLIKHQKYEGDMRANIAQATRNVSNAFLTS